MLKKGLIFLTLVLGVVSYVVWQKFTQFAQIPITPKAGQFFTLEKGTSSIKLADKLLQEGFITEQTRQFLPYWLRLQPELNQFKAGVYQLDDVTNLQTLFEKFNSGKEAQLNLRFIEGKTFSVWREQLKNAPYLNQTLADKSEAEIAQLLGISHAKLEGWFAPDTYRYTPYSDDVDILKRAYQMQQQNLATAWQNRAENLPLANPYEMLILASIVEKETGIAKERPQVASVFINRLNRKMLLQTDPTILYGKCGCYDEKIYKSDILKPTPYNTYVIEGLPPTPIAMPSFAAINAVARPDNTPYLYFVADGTGGHKFSRSLEEHNKAVQEWRKIERNKASY